MLLLCLSDVAVHGDFRFRREVNETVEPTSIAALRSCRRHAVVPTIVLQTRTSFKNNSTEIYELKCYLLCTMLQLATLSICRGDVAPRASWVLHGRVGQEIRYPFCYLLSHRTL
ncbi:PREDICTED: uncharacterized protein LOC105144154 [Acromyrmex echinatior]|uniref:uncharacterized protein LOC105144154 n=1 Tax=Acromyrmex echinatior TaxID=103372 RepID=UPI0005810702|nr:PREDICTED: uncharacterized protein LOC105144154 [Acromyrmex echinatior]